MLYIGFRQCEGYSHAQYVRLPEAALVNTTCFIRGLEAFDHLTTDLPVVLDIGRLQGPYNPGPVVVLLRSSSQSERSSNPSLWNQFLAVMSLTALSSKAGRIW